MVKRPWLFAIGFAVALVGAGVIGAPDGDMWWEGHFWFGTVLILAGTALIEAAFNKSRRIGDE